MEPVPNGTCGAFLNGSIIALISLAVQSRDRQQLNISYRRSLAGALMKRRAGGIFAGAIGRSRF
jgi:hypothetical protein